MKKQLSFLHINFGISLILFFGAIFISTSSCISQSTTALHNGIDGWFLGWDMGVSDVLNIGHYANQPIIFSTKNQERMRVTKEYVVIGANTAPPSSQLEVVQTVGHTGVYALNDNLSLNNTNTALQL